MSWSMALRRSPKPGRLHSHRRERAPDLVDDQRGECLALEILSDHQQRLAALHHLLEKREHVLHRRDLLVGDQDVRVLEDRLLPIGVRDEVRRDVALVELHSLRELQLDAERLAVFDGDDTLVADLLQRFSDPLADRRVSGRVGCDVGDLVT